MRECVECERVECVECKSGVGCECLFTYVRILG